MTETHQKVAVVGASPKEDRYSNRAQRMLMEKGYTVFPVSNRTEDILGLKPYKSVLDIPDDLDTVTLYINPQRMPSVIDEIAKKKPKRVIFNPGTESSEHMNQLESQGIHVVQACSLVLLSTNQFEKY